MGGNTWCVQSGKPHLIPTLLLVTHNPGMEGFLAWVVSGCNINKYRSLDQWAFPIGRKMPFSVDSKRVLFVLYVRAESEAQYCILRSIKR